jgi:hypothetical protein
MITKKELEQALAKVPDDSWFYTYEDVIVVLAPDGTNRGVIPAEETWDFKPGTTGVPRHGKEKDL